MGGADVAKLYSYAGDVRRNLAVYNKDNKFHLTKNIFVK